MSDDRRDLRTWLARTKAAPARIDRINARQETVVTDLDAILAEVRRLDARIEELQQRIGATEAHLGPTAGELKLVRQVVEERALVLDGALTAHAAVLRRVSTAADRLQSFQRLITELGPSVPLRPGLSTFTASWNHAGFLEEAVHSALATLDVLPPEMQGEVLVVDNGSVDETPATLDRLCRLDPRVRAVRTPVNLGANLGRNVALHLATTTHAFQLDADNMAEPQGVAALLEVATRYRAALVYGSVLKVNGDGRTIGVMSNEPVTPAFFGSNYIDTMAVIDVEALRSVGGWPGDPVMEHIDDWAATHALLRHGHLVGFVPEVAGRYRVLDGAMHGSTPDPRLGNATVHRTWNSDGRLTAESVSTFAAHPSLGPLWATAAAIARRPALAPAATDLHTEPESRVLVVGPGGVGNVGDDAITVATVDRLRNLLPGTGIDVVTDGEQPVGLSGAAWRGTLGEAVRGLPIPLLDPARYSAAVFAGGGSITSAWTSGLIEPRLALARQLTGVGVSYVMGGQGIGPLDDDRSRQMVAELIAGAKAVSVRDRASAELCSEMGQADTGKPLTATGDDALDLVPASAEALRRSLETAGIGEQPYLAVTVRVADYVGDHDLELWADAADRYADERGMAVVGVALNDMGAEPELARLAALAHGGVARRARWGLVACERDPRLLAAVMAGAEAAAVHSYHAALFALIAGKPVVLAAGSEYYRRKASGLASLAGLPDDLVVDPGGPLDLSARLDAVAAAQADGAGLGPACEAVATWWRRTAQALLSEPGTAQSTQGTEKQPPSRSAGQPGGGIDSPSKPQENTDGP